MILYIPLIPTCEPLLIFFSGSAPAMYCRLVAAIAGDIIVDSRQQYADRMVVGSDWYACYVEHAVACWPMRC